MLITKDSCDLSDLELFIKKCRRIGYRDHRDIKQLEINKTINERWGKFFYTYKGQNIIALSGCHEFSFLQFYDDKSKYIEGMRICFRGAQLPGEDTYKKLSKYHMNSIPFREHVPLAIEWGKSLGYNRFFITTHNWHGNPANLYRGPSKTQNRTNKVMKLLCKMKVVNNCGDHFIRNYNQTIWELNQDEYFRLQALTKN